MNDSAVPCIVFLVIILAVLVIAGIAKASRQREIAKALMAYRESLVKLKQNPANPDVKERTLYLGRVYSNLTRNRKGITTFDEVALMNDINAACAGVGAAQASTAPKEQKSHEERLASLSRLKQAGIITDQEYEQRMAEILREM